MNNFSDFLRNYFGGVLTKIGEVAKATFDVLLAVIFPILSPLLYKIARVLNDRYPDLWRKLTSPMVVRRWISTLTIRKFGNVTKPRPHAFSMHADYPTWTGMVMRNYSGRHLPSTDVTGRKPMEPEAADLEQLFMRPAEVGAQIDDVRSNLLFASFAQWFTDSFLRTSHKLHFDDNGNSVEAEDGTRERADGHKRERENDSNHEIDLCQIYGVNEAQTRALRFTPDDPGYDPKKHKGTLKSQMIGDAEFPAKLLSTTPEEGGKLSFTDTCANVFPKEQQEHLLRMIFSSAFLNEQGHDSLFACGLEHGNSTIGNSLYNTLFLRHHNHVARAIAEAHPTYDDDAVFEKSRNVMIVILLQIVISDYVRHISPLNLPFMVPPNFSKGQDWYRSNRIHIEFNLLYRWHSLVPDLFPFLGNQEDPKKNVASFRHNNQWLIDAGVEKTIYDFMATPAGKMIIGNTPQAMRMVKRDTIKLMRAAKLANYNDYRERFSLPRAKSFEDVTGEKVISAALSDLYGGDIENLEFYTGLVAEKHIPGGMMGALLFNMVAHDAFTHALTNPLLAEDMHVRLTPEMAPGEHVFTKTGLKFIKEVQTLDALVRNVADPEKYKDPASFRKPH